MVKELPYHDCYIFIVDAVVIDGWLEEVGVLFEPIFSSDLGTLRFRVDFTYHFGRFSGLVSIVGVWISERKCHDPFQSSDFILPLHSAAEIRRGLYPSSDRGLSISNCSSRGEVRHGRSRFLRYKNSEEMVELIKCDPLSIFVIYCLPDSLIFS